MGFQVLLSSPIRVIIPVAQSLPELNNPMGLARKFCPPKMMDTHYIYCHINQKIEGADYFIFGEGKDQKLWPVMGLILSND